MGFPSLLQAVAVCIINPIKSVIRADGVTLMFLSMADSLARAGHSKIQILKEFSRNGVEARG